MFAHRLAKELGCYNVDEMLASAAPGQLADWKEFYRREPFGDDWHQASVVATQIINAINSIQASFAGKALGDSDILPTDFFVPGKGEIEATSHKITDPSLMAIALRMQTGM